MEKLKQDGKKRFVGVSNFGVRNLVAALDCAEVVTDQLVYSLLFRAIVYEILDKCKTARVGVLAYSPLAQGLLTGKFKGPDEVLNSLKEATRQVKENIGPNADPWRTASRIR
jgi:aryl-alcohol dehydrogenase-like predicted oxidoreductase